MSPDDRFKYDRTSSNRAGVTLMNYSDVRVMPMFAARAAV